MSPTGRRAIPPRKPLLTEQDRDHVRAVVEWFRSDDAPDVFEDVTTHLDDPTLVSTFVADDGQAVFLLVGLNTPPPKRERFRAGILRCIHATNARILRSAAIAQRTG